MDSRRDGDQVSRAASESTLSASSAVSSPELPTPSDTALIEAGEDRPSRRSASVRLSFMASALAWLSPRMWCIEREAAPLAELVKPGAVCVDIGAGYGLYSLLFAAAAGPQGRTLAVEANPRLVARLRRLATAAGVSALHPVWAAVSGTAGVGTWLSVPYRRYMPVYGRAFTTHGARHNGPNSEFARHREIELTTTTLDHLAETHSLAHIDVVKADIEGAEYAMLCGARTVLERHRPIWMLEIEERHLAKYGHRSSDLVELMASYGYQMYQLHDREWQECSQVSNATRNYLFRIS